MKITERLDTIHDIMKGIMTETQGSVETSIEERFNKIFQSITSKLQIHSLESNILSLIVLDELVDHCDDNLTFIHNRIQKEVKELYEAITVTNITKPEIDEGEVSDAKILETLKEVIREVISNITGTETHYVDYIVDSRLAIVSMIECILGAEEGMTTDEVIKSVYTQFIHEMRVDKRNPRQFLLTSNV